MYFNFIRNLASFIMLAFICSLGCTQPQNDPTKNGEYPPTTVGTAENSRQANMEASFKKSRTGVDANLKISGLQPNSVHGIHIHDVGVCLSPSFETSGDHFNPSSQPHGAPGTAHSHLGDLGNVTADNNGNFSGTIFIKDATSDGPNGILRRSLIVHEKTDDMKTQPSGDSGARIACLVINSIE